MVYRYALARENQEDLASGGVLYSAPGFPAFPVRLASEMFQRALALREGRPAMVWDPCGGSGYLLTVLALLHRPQITRVLGTDLDPAALRLTRQNLGLLSGDGLAVRSAELQERSGDHRRPLRRTDRLARTHGTAGIAGMLWALETVLADDAVIAVAVRGRKVPLE